MQRTQIYLDPTQSKLLKNLARERKVSLSELIRESIWNWLAGQQGPKKSAISESSLAKIVGLYDNKKDSHGSTQHDDLYE